MTAATVEELGLEHPSALRLAHQLADVADDGVPHAQAARAAQHPRADLTLYRVLLVERYGPAPPLDRILARDELLAELTVLAIA